MHHKVGVILQNRLSGGIVLCHLLVFLGEIHQNPDGNKHQEEGGVRHEITLEYVSVNYFHSLSKVSLGLQTVIHLADHLVFPLGEIALQDMLSCLTHQPKVEAQVVNRGDLLT